MTTPKDHLVVVDADTYQALSELAACTGVKVPDMLRCAVKRYVHEVHNAATHAQEALK